MKKILVVVDMQNDFITGPLGTPEAVSIVDKVVEKIRGEEWDYIYYTLDTHDEKYLETQEGKKLSVEHCIYKKNGWMLHGKVWEAIFNHHYCNQEGLLKSTFGSIDLPGAIEFLMSCDDFEDVPIQDIELTLVGVCTDICVISNALLLKAHYPEMKIVVDASCCAGSNFFKHVEALDVMKSCQIDIINDPIAEMAEKMIDAEIARFEAAK